MVIRNWFLFLFINGILTETSSSCNQSEDWICVEVFEEGGVLNFMQTACVFGNCFILIGRCVHLWKKIFLQSVYRMKGALFRFWTIEKKSKLLLQDFGWEIFVGKIKKIEHFPHKKGENKWWWIYAMKSRWWWGDMVYTSTGFVVDIATLARHTSRTHLHKDPPWL